MGRKTNNSIDIVREKMRAAIEQSGLTQEEVGLRMGLPKSSARQSVSRLVNKDVKHDPRLSTLLSLAKALEMPITDLLS
jgi:transcriptional regulator with XRE-family HTH domain